MEPMDPGLVEELRKHVAMARVIGFSLCFLAPAIYLLLLVQMAFHGNPRPLVAGFHSVPWGDLRIIVLSMAGLTLLAAGPYLVHRFWARANAAETAEGVFANLRAGHILHCAMLESVAIFGLVLGFTVGTGAGPVCLVMSLVPPVGYLLFVPGARPRLRLLSLRAAGLPGGRLAGPTDLHQGDGRGAP